LSSVNVDYFANHIDDEDHFAEALRNILIPRVPGTEGSRIVREVSLTSRN